MVRLTALFVLLVSLVVGMSGASAQELVTGTVVRVDPAGIVYLGYFGSARADAGQGSLLDVATDLGIVKKSGAWFTYEGEQLGQGR